MLPSSHSRFVGDQSQDSLNDAENGVYDSTTHLTAPIPLVYIHRSQSRDLRSPLSGTASPIHQGITPAASVPELSLQWPVEQKPVDAKVLETTLKPSQPPPPKPKVKISRWILFQLWYNTYRKLFTFVILLNLAGIITAACSRFPYAENHMGALVLGNLLCAILMRNELFLRVLYTVAIYGLRGVSTLLCLTWLKVAD
jgi:hypothetical protein